ncbi:MAG: DEAD/DEAH box helicase family protein [Ktedonobacteraceae bacterium]
MLFCLTGANGAGKSTCLSGLRSLHPHTSWYDLHDHGVVPSDASHDIPLNSTTAWRQAITEYWLQKALLSQAQGQDMGVCGAVFGELLACPSAESLAGIAVIMLDCSDVVRIDRLRARGDGPECVTQDILSWAAWQRMHAADPQWRQDVIRAEGAPQMHWQRWEYWQRGDERWSMPIIDTTHLPLEKVVEQIAGWMLMQKHLYAQGNATLQENWWEETGKRRPD